MSLLRPKIVDARGARMPLLAPLDSSWRRRRRELQRHVDTAGVWTRRNVAIAAAVSVPVVLSGLIIPTIVLLRLPIWLVFAAIVPVGALPAVSCVLMQQWMLSRRLRDALVKSGVCPSCGYDLAATPVNADESRVCPECGGVWGGAGE